MSMMHEFVPIWLCNIRLFNLWRVLRKALIASYPFFISTVGSTTFFVPCFLLFLKLRLVRLLPFSYRTPFKIFKSLISLLSWFYPLDGLIWIQPNSHSLISFWADFVVLTGFLFGPYKWALAQRSIHAPWIISLNPCSGWNRPVI